jgi:hypothetical protein
MYFWEGYLYHSLETFRVFSVAVFYRLEYVFTNCIFQPRNVHLKSLRTL